LASPDPPDERPRFTQLRKGRWYWEPPLRLRRSHDLQVRALGADTPAAWAYARKLNKELANLDPEAPAPGTVAWLFEQFFASERFQGLAPNTQRDYRWLAKKLGGIQLGNQPLGCFQARAIRPRHADKLYALFVKESGHNAAHYACRVARRVWKWAGRRELVDPHPNPWAEMELQSIPQRDQQWTPEQVQAVVAKAKELGRPSIGLAVELAYWLGHRQADVLSLTWSVLAASERKTSKTGATVPIDAAAYPDLDAAIAEERGRQQDVQGVLRWTHLVVCETTKQPWNRYTFTHEFRRIAKAAGIPDELQFRDLRATALTELKDAGADVIDMSTHSGHKTVSMSRRYARRTPEQFRRAAAKRMAARRKD
jgi:integrase